MPITPAHAAAAWPLYRAAPRLPLSALVIGTFSPDLEYLLRLQPIGKFGHRPAGLVFFCIPMTLVIWWGWRDWVRPALVPLLPPGLQRAAMRPQPGRRADLLPLAVVAALSGALTHVFWDGFTHGNGWGVRLFPAMNHVASPRFGLLWFSVAQYLSSVVGVLVVLLWIVVEVRRHPPESRRFAPGQAARVVRVALFVAACVLVAAAANATLARDWMNALGRAAVGAEAGLGIGLLAYAWYARRVGLVASTASSTE